MIRKTNAVIAIAAVAAFSTGALSAQRSEGAKAIKWEVDGQTRGAIVYPPSSNAAGPAPLVLSFHGRGDNARNFQYTSLHSAWPEAIVVYFQGLPSSRDGLFGWQVEKGQDGDRDLRLVDVAVRALSDTYKVDPARIYSTGFSNGANFTYLLWAERPAVFAAFAPVAGRLRSSVRPAQRKPIIHIGGVRDGQILFSDQQDAINTATRVNGVEGAAKSCGDGCTLFASPAGTPVMTWIHPGGHVYPDETSERVAQFFREHPVRP